MQEVLREVFHNFYSVILQNLYTSTFMKSYSMITKLVKKQIDLLETALEGGLPDDMIYELYRSAAKVHWNLRIHEKAIFGMLEYLREELLRVSDRLPERASKRINEVIDNMKEANAEAYIIGILEDALTILGRDEELLNEHVLWLEAFYKALKDNEKPPVFDPQECLLGKWFKSLTFEVMSHMDQELKLKILATHKEIHEAARLAYALYYKGEKEQTLPLVRELTENSFLLNSFLKELFLRWETSKHYLFFSFLKKQFLKQGLLIITFNKALIQLKGAGLGIGKLKEEFLEDLKKQFWLHEAISFMQEKHTLYFIVDTSKFSHEKIINYLERKAEKVLEKYKEFIELPVIIAGIIQPEKLKDLSIQELQLLIEILEGYLAKTEHESVLVVEDLTPKLPQFLKQVRHQIKIKNLLQEALKEKSFELYFQPIYLITGDEPVGWYECLARLKDEKGRIIPAMEFIPILNQTGWHEAFDEALISSVIKRLKDIRKFASRIFVNLHPRSLSSKEIAKLIEKLSVESEKVGLRVVLELTEYEELMRFELAERLKPGLIELAIDDFGSGYANFELVGKLAERKVISFVKIDGSLVKNALTSSAIRSVVEAIVILAVDLNLHLIFEHIESQEMVDMIKEMLERIKSRAAHRLERIGFFGQGYHYAKPVSINELLMVV